MNDIKLDKKIIYVTGLPRSGSTLLCQLLGHHPDIYSPGHSSPLCHTLNNIRKQLSNDSFLLSQLDTDYDLVYGRIRRAMRGYVNGWFAETNLGHVVDKNRDWLRHIDLVQDLDPDFRMLVCIRELGQIHGSIDERHLKTILIDGPEHRGDQHLLQRANLYFKSGGLVTRSLAGIESLIQDVPAELAERVLFIKFEHLTGDTQGTMDTMTRWLGLPGVDLDINNLSVKPGESDSHYYFKYSHKTRDSIRAGEPHQVARDIQKDLTKRYGWYYDQFYNNA